MYTNQVDVFVRKGLRTCEIDVLRVWETGWAPAREGGLRAGEKNGMLALTRQVASARGIECMKFK